MLLNRSKLNYIPLEKHSSSINKRRQESSNFNLFEFCSEIIFQLNLTLFLSLCSRAKLHGCHPPTTRVQFPSSVLFKVEPGNGNIFSNQIKPGLITLLSSLNLNNVGKKRREKLFTFLFCLIFIGDRLKADLIFFLSSRQNGIYSFSKTLHNV